MVEYKGKRTKVNGELRKEISELKLTEKKLRESDGKYRKLMEAANDAIFIVDTETGIILDANKQVEVLLGIKADEIIGMHYTNVHPVEEGKRIKKLFEKYVKINKSITSEVIFVQHKDGRKIPVEISISFFKLEGKKVIHGIFRDVTERKRYEDQLRKLSCAVGQSPATVIITDIKGNIEYVNPKFTQLTGYTFKETIGKNLRILKSGKTPPEEYKQLWETITSGREWYGEFCNKKKNGELYWESASIWPIRNTEGVITHFVGIKEDITKRKKAEKRLKAQYLVTRVLAEAIIIKDAFSKILETICTALEWDIGEIWIIDQQENVLRNVEIWHIPSFKIPEFKAITKQITFPLQIGLPGRVWECAQPLWIEDVVRDTNFLRASVAAKEGVRGAFGFPILSGSEVIGTINFFSQELKHPDKYLLNMMSAIGIQIGLFIKRKQAEELLHVQKKDLEHKNIALSEVLGQIELEKKQIKDNVIANVENLLLPIIQKLMLKRELRKYVQLLQKNIQELTSSFGAKPNNKKAKLTSREIEICNMVKNGLTSKEIAGLLNISLQTIEKHRSHIRKKLGIVNKKLNLSTALKTL